MTEPIRKLCTLCERRPATRAAGKSGRAGTELCEACWREEFTDPRGGE